MKTSVTAFQDSAAIGAGRRINGMAGVGRSTARALALALSLLVTLMLGWPPAARSASMGPASPEPAVVAAKPDPLVAMFVWWNAAYKQKDGFTAQSFGRYFTSDAVMRINGKDRCHGLEDLAQHFRAIQAQTELVVIDLPFIDEFTNPNGDHIFTHHFVRAREHGKDSRERVMGYAQIRDGKISLINFVSIPDPTPPAVAKP